MPPSAASQIERLIALAERAPQPGDPPDLDTFLQAYFGDVHPEHLADRDPQALLEIARRHRALADRRRPGAIGVDVYTPSHAHSARARAVATVAADMPFLVDTVSMAVRDAGGAIDWMLHPVLRIRRDGDGGIQSVPGPPGDDSYGDEESLIDIQFAAGSDFDADDLAGRVRRRLDDLQAVVDDWGGMRRRVQHAINELDSAGGIDEAERDEAEAFLRWLADDHFTFLGYRERVVESDAGGEELMQAVPDSSLGLLRADRPGIDPDGYVAPAAEIDKYALSPRLVVVTKANARAWIHHADFMDVIAVKRLDAAGNVIGAYRFLGLFSGEAYAASPRSIPIMRRKVRNIIARAALRPRSHTAKTLHYVLETFPRDELFQSGDEELYATVMGVVALRESLRLRLFMRRDRYGRFFSCLVYVPRERYSLALRQRLGQRLAALLDGQARESSAQFLRGALVRVHFIVATEPGTEVELATEAIESRLLEALRTWRDDFDAAIDALSDPQEARILSGYADAFPVAYTERYPAAEAVADACVLETLYDVDAPRLCLRANGEAALSVKLYGRGEAPTVASVLPVLENFGLHVVSQRPFALSTPGGAAWIHEFASRPAADGVSPGTGATARIETAFTEIWTGRAENDGLDRLVIAAGLDVRQVALVRTMVRYLQQTLLPFSQHYVETQLAAHSDVVAAIVDLFDARCRPSLDGDRHERELAATEYVHELLEAVAGPDADRVLRAVLGVVLGTLRTNYYRAGADGAPRPYISLKLSPGQLPELPAPRPMFETFVYAPEVEGVHLRAGRVARGGIRWSDRREDFRTEVLGLMKAQVVRNSVIVPVGAKGGFVVKNLADSADPETRQERGIAAYKTFIRGLLDVTDNHVYGAIVPPPDVVRHDADDPYLVVAADKGTASFSDIANELSQDYGFWLDDAFASGGSAGYDHKTMGITARGAWVAVERHFRELGRDIRSEQFTVVGVGDMGGDVFGNGMLLSRQIRLVAAFNHRHIFIDPEPDPATGFAERQRLFQAEAAGWDAYDRDKLSAGGGIYERSAKLIELSTEAQAALGIERAQLSPNELVHELIRAPVDLFWNGGIGTYVKARHESHADVGDRANDALRADGRDLRCRVIGEGGNLGMTQAGRIEFARAGGRLNTDAIDNSGGVDSSDLEVNIKIALNAVEGEGRLTRAQRNELLADMTESVAALVLDTNYLQTQLISVLEVDAVTRLDEQVHFMRALERDGLLQRRIEGLPEDEAIEERLRSGEGLTRPELAVLVSYAKIALFDDVVDSDLPDEPYLEGELFAGFPPALGEQHPDAVRGHRLRREIVATLATNRMVDRMGVALAHRAAAESGVARAEVVRAFLLAAGVFDAEALWRDIEALDNHLAAAVQYRLLKHVAGLVKHGMTWLLARPRPHDSMQAWLSRYREPARTLLAELPSYLAGGYREAYDLTLTELREAGIGNALAQQLATVQNAGGALDILSLALDTGEPLDRVARLYFRVGDWLSLPWLQGAITALAADDRWQALARGSLRDDCYRSHRRIAGQALASAGEDADARLQAWQEARTDEAEFTRQRLVDLQTGEAPGFAHLAVAVRELGRLGGSSDDTGNGR